MVRAMFNRGIPLLLLLGTAGACVDDEPPPSQTQSEIPISVPQVTPTPTDPTPGTTETEDSSPGETPTPGDMTNTSDESQSPGESPTPDGSHTPAVTNSPWTPAPTIAPTPTELGKTPGPTPTAGGPTDPPHGDTPTPVGTPPDITDPQVTNPGGETPDPTDPATPGPTAAPTDAPTAGPTLVPTPEPTALPDSDGDGIPDAEEGDGDTDGDGIPDYQDEDSDNDGIPDADEGNGDTDGDGTPDYQDDDSDGDGIPDADEGDGDTDGDGVPDYQDDDSDGDGIPDADEGDGDTDGDGIPDYQDDDSDDDGIPDADEGDGDTDGDDIPDYQDDDSDDDGIPDADEGDGDTDGDGIPDYQDDDSDDDGIPDADEGDGDTDGDDIPDYQDDDSDDDGIPDADEGDGDTDGDDIPDYQDDDSDGDGIPDADEGDGDTDGDGVPDYQDDDSDGDGIPDDVEGDGDTDGDGVPDYQDDDSDGDGIPDEDDCDSEDDEGCISCSDVPSEIEILSLCDNGHCPNGFERIDRVDSNITNHGITFDGDDLVVSANDAREVLRVSMDNGDSDWLFDTPQNSPTGLAHHDGVFYLADYDGGDIDIIDAQSGGSLGRLESVGETLRGLDYWQGSLWVMNRDAHTLNQINLETGANEGAWPVNLQSPSGIGYCNGFPIIADRDDQTLHVYDLAGSRFLYRQEMSGIDDLYGLTCGSGQLWAADPDRREIHELEKPSRSRRLGDDSQRSGDSILGLDREFCSPFETWDVDAPEGSVIQAMVAHIDMPVAVIVWDEDEPVWVKEVPTGGVVAIPNFTAEDGKWRIEVTGLTSDASGRYGLWVTTQGGSMKRVSGTVYGDDIPLPGAEVYVDSDTSYIGTLSDADGDYALSIPRDTTPDIVLITATHEGYQPDVEQVNTNTGDEIIDFYLYSDSPSAILITSDVIHLGDNNYDGSINSQFQTDPLGNEIEIPFEVSAEHLLRDTVELSLVVKGAQHTNGMYINDIYIGDMIDSPEDGSYGEYSWEFWRGLLNVGTNTFRVESSLNPNDASDHDDFEFSMVLLSFQDVDDYAPVYDWQLPIWMNPFGMTWVDDTLYFIQGDPAELWIFDPRTESVTDANISVNRYVTGMEWAGGNEVYLSLPDEGAIIRYNIGSGLEVDRFSAPGSFIRDLSYDGEALWATDRDSEAVYRMDPDSGEVLGMWSLGEGNPSGCEGTQTAFWTTYRDESEVTVFNLDEGRVIANLGGIIDPYVIDFKDGHAWVLDRLLREIHALDAPQ